MVGFEGTETNQQVEGMTSFFAKMMEKNFMFHCLQRWRSN
jgi:hypothetical protein